jgi:hypothetical protein
MERIRPDSPAKKEAMEVTTPPAGVLFLEGWLLTWKSFAIVYRIGRIHIAVALVNSQCCQVRLYRLTEPFGCAGYGNVLAHPPIRGTTERAYRASDGCGR